jgi:pyruvate dehydrogenase E2 component (dihydrolipoamide acetyltransferase)
MARIEIVMPQMGESITNGTIKKWNKNIGDVIELDEIMLEISTDKVESEIPSPVKGRLEVVHYSEGETVDVGLLIAEIETDLSQPMSAASQGSSGASKLQESQEQGEQKPTAEGSPSDSASSGERRFYTPLVKAMATEAGIPLSDLESISGSGAGGRVNKSDLLKYIEGLSGKSQKPQASSAQSQAPSPATPAPVQEVRGSYNPALIETIPMDNMRKAIAKNMVLSKQISPHVNSVSEVDLTHLVKFREGFKNEFQKQEGFKLTYTPFIMKAIIDALKEHPLVNSSIEGDNVIQKKYINLGFAVAVPGQGLTVPNVKDADTLNMTGLCRALSRLADKARNRKLTLDEMSDGTFTFSNVGSFGTLLATPIILQPQVGIYASGVIQKRVMVGKDDSIGVRSMMYGTHSYDHRLIDGEQGGLFLEAIHRNLRGMNPSQLF